MVDLNVRAVVDLTRRFLPGMLARRQGGVLNIASMMGLMPVPYEATYAASKAFVLSFSKALAYETMGTGVKVSVAAPGVVATRLHAKAGSLNARYLSLFPALTPEQVAKTAYRRFSRGWSTSLPGFSNKLGAFHRALRARLSLGAGDGLVLQDARRRGPGAVAGRRYRKRA